MVQVVPEILVVLAVALGLLSEGVLLCASSKFRQWERCPRPQVQGSKTGLSPGQPFIHSFNSTVLSVPMYSCDALLNKPFLISPVFSYQKVTYYNGYSQNT